MTSSARSGGAVDAGAVGSGFLDPGVARTAGSGIRAFPADIARQSLIGSD